MFSGSWHWSVETRAGMERTAWDIRPRSGADERPMVSYTPGRGISDVQFGVDVRRYSALCSLCPRPGLTLAIREVYCHPLPCQQTSRDGHHTHSCQACIYKDAIHITTAVEGASTLRGTS